MSGNGIEKTSTSNKARREEERDRDNLVPVVHMDRALFQLLHMQFSQALSPSKDPIKGSSVRSTSFGGVTFASASDEQVADARA